MSKELADRMEKVASDLLRDGMLDNAESKIIDEAIAALRSEPVAGQLSAEQIENYRQDIKEQFFKGAHEGIDTLCDMALSSLRGTFADGIEARQVYAAMSVLAHSRTSQENVNDVLEAIRALAQDQRSEAERVGGSQPNSGTQSSDHPTEQDADELLREARNKMRYMVHHGEWYAPQGTIDRIDAHLSRKEQCVVNPVMSCVCNRGTKSCIISHAKEQ